MRAAVPAPLVLPHPTSLSLQGELDPPEPMCVRDLDECFFPLSSTAISPGPENFLCEMEEIPFNPVQSWLKHDSSQGEGWKPCQLPTALILGVCFRGRWLSFFLSIFTQIIIFSPERTRWISDNER